jgi:C-terminal processing protease CtpA/Prc
MQAKRIFFGPFGLFLVIFVAIFAAGMAYLQTEWLPAQIPTYDDPCDERTPSFIFKINEALMTHHYRGEELDPVNLINMDLRAIQKVMLQNGLGFDVRPNSSGTQLVEAMIQFEKVFMRAREEFWQARPDLREAPDFGLSVAREALRDFGSSHTHLLPSSGYEQYSDAFEYGVVEYPALGLMLIYGQPYPDSVYVECVAPGSPAHLAGIRKFDRIMDGPDFASLHRKLSSFGDLRVAIAASGGEDCRVVDLRASSEADYSGQVFVAVSGAAAGKKMLYVAFYDFTTTVVSKIIRAIVAAEPDGIILDIRNNRGGALTALDTLFSVFLPPDTPTYSLKSKSTQEPLMTTHDFFGGLRVPVVVLINERTFSSAELFAHVLHECDRALIVGMPTWGGVECIGWDDRGAYRGIPISRNTSLAVANFSVMTAKGTVMEGRPLQPHVLAPLPAEQIMVGRDVQAAAAVAVMIKELQK